MSSIQASEQAVGAEANYPSFGSIHQWQEKAEWHPPTWTTPVLFPGLPYEDSLSTESSLG